MPLNFFPLMVNIAFTRTIMLLLKIISIFQQFQLEPLIVRKHILLLYPKEASKITVQQHFF